MTIFLSVEGINGKSMQLCQKNNIYIYYYHVFCLLSTQKMMIFVEKERFFTFCYIIAII